MLDDFPGTCAHVGLGALCLEAAKVLNSGVMSH